MNQNKSKKIIIILIIILTILILIGGFVYAYLTTDIFRNDKELFLKYIMKMADTKEGFIDETLMKYFEKKKTSQYANNGTFNVNVAVQKDQDKFKKLNNFNITFSGQMDEANSRVMQDISLNYSNSIKFPLAYKQISDTIGLQTKYVGAKFIAIKTEKINELPKEVGKEIENINNNLINIQSARNVKITEEQKEYILKTYIEIINKELNINSFSKIEEANSNGYKISLTGEELKNVLTQLLETLKNDKTTLDTINQILGLNKIETDNIKELIENINNNTNSDNEKIEIIVYIHNGNANKLGITTNNGTIYIEKIVENGQIKISITYESNNEKISKVSFTTIFDGINTLQNVKENYELILEYNSQETGETSYKYQLNNNVDFPNAVNIEEFNSENSMTLTDYSTDSVSDFLNAVTERITQVNKQQMEELGVAEGENPLKYIMPSLEIYSNYIDTDSMNELEITTFNQKFDVYAGTNLKGVTVKGLFTTILNNNDSQKENGRKIEEINFDGDEYEATEQNITLLKSTIETEASYKVEFEKNENTGIIYRVVINKK